MKFYYIGTNLKRKINFYPKLDILIINILWTMNVEIKIYRNKKRLFQMYALSIIINNSSNFRINLHHCA